MKMAMKYALMIIAVSGSAAVAQEAGTAVQSTNPPIAITNSPPPQIVAVPVDPGTPIDAIPYPPGPPPQPPVAKIVRPPQPRRMAQDYLTSEDYPASALAMGQEGWVGFTLDIGPDGRVAGCAITSSSGSTALDSATCRLMRSRGRFTPAINSHGMPARGQVRDEVEWALPN